MNRIDDLFQYLEDQGENLDWDYWRDSALEGASEIADDLRDSEEFWEDLEGSWDNRSSTFQRCLVDTLFSLNDPRAVEVLKQMLLGVDEDPVLERVIDCLASLDVTDLSGEERDIVLDFSKDNPKLAHIKLYVGKIK